MLDATNIRILDRFDMNTGYRAVVQKGNVGSKYVYGLQLRNNQTETHVLRGFRGNVTTPVLTLVGAAAGHTQTWEYSGRSGKWFVGTKNKNKWASQIARADIRYKSYASSNTEFPRLAYLNRAGNPEDQCSGDEMERAEVAVSPDYSMLLIATIENNGTGHFSIYDLNVINNALDEAGNNCFVNMGNYQCETSFTVYGLYGSVLNSVQGYDLDNSGNIYITSQKSPSLSNGSWSYYHKEIVKIPFYARNDQSQWENVNLSAFGGLDISDEHSEVESIQIIDENHGYLTVAYHANVNGKNKTVSNKVYELAWD